MSRRRRTANPAELARERRDPTADRRDDRARRQIEVVLDRVFRPTRWAARAAYALHLQSARPVVVSREDVPVTRAAGAPALTIAFASDFHAGATTDNRVLRAACDALAALTVARSSCRAVCDPTCHTASCREPTRPADMTSTRPTVAC